MANNNCKKLAALPACTHKLDKRRPALQWSSAEPHCWQMKTSAWLNIAQSEKNNCTPSYKATVANSCCTQWTNQLILTWCDTPWLSWAKQRRALNSIVFCFILHAELNSSCRWTKQSEPLLVRNCPPDPDWNHSVNRFEPIHFHTGLITLVNMFDKRHKCDMLSAFVLNTTSVNIHCWDLPDNRTLALCESTAFYKILTKEISCTSTTTESVIECARRWLHHIKPWDWRLQSPSWGIRGQLAPPSNKKKFYS